VTTSRPQPDPHTATIMARWEDEQLTDRMGIRITGWDPVRVVGTMPVDGNRQPFGLLHGVPAPATGMTLSGLGWLQISRETLP
jgi:hypothetical protein